MKNSEIIAIVLINIIIIIRLFISLYKVWGLNGGYGKGVWAESSSFMMDARENLNNSIIGLLIIILLDILLLF